jgi:hypothetical protein
VRSLSQATTLRTCGNARTANANGPLLKTIDGQEQRLGVARHGRIVETATGRRPGHPVIATVRTIRLRPVTNRWRPADQRGLLEPSTERERLPLEFAQQLVRKSVVMRELLGQQRRRRLLR